MRLVRLTTNDKRAKRRQKGTSMADKNEEMAQQMRADGVDEAMIARFVAKEMQEDEFRRGRGMTDIEAARA